MSFNATLNVTDCSAFEEEGGGMLLGVSKWIIGVVFGLLGSIAINTGNNIQSLGLMRLEEEAQRLKKEREEETARGFGEGGGGETERDERRAHVCVVKGYIYITTMNR